jgi:hypothetical protein
MIILPMFTKPDPNAPPPSKSDILIERAFIALAFFVTIGTMACAILRILERH